MSSLGDQRSLNPMVDKLGITHEREDRCDHCRARITRTPTMGEVGHRLDCPVRDERYNGRSNKRWAELEGRDE